MRHGYYMGDGFYGSYIFSSLIILVVILLILFVLYKQNKNFIFEKEVEILRERYVREEIGASEFSEKEAIIESLENSSSALKALVTRYVKGEIDSKKYFEFLKQIEK